MNVCRAVLRCAHVLCLHERACLLAGALHRNEQPDAD